MRLLKKIIVGIGIVAVSWTTSGVNAQTSQPAGDAAAPPPTLQEQVDASRDFINQFNNAADLERATLQRALDELGSKLGLTAAQEAKILPDRSQLGHFRFDMPIPKLMENGSRDPKFPFGTLNDDCRICWSAWVELVEAVDDPATPVAVLRSRIKSWQGADATARADQMTIERRIAAGLTARQIALYPAMTLLGDARESSFKWYKLDRSNPFTTHFSGVMSQVGASTSNPYGGASPGLHKALQSVLKIGDDEYAVLQPKVEAVCVAAAKTGIPGRLLVNIQNKRGRISDLADMNYDGILGVLVELDAAVRDPDTTEEIFAQEERELSAAVRDANKDFNKAENDLRSVLTTRQEAIMILEGVLQ